MIEVTAGTWHEAITTGRAWDKQRDTPRIRSAFVTLAQTADRWPQPRHFLDALPRVEQVAIAYDVKPLPPEEAAPRLADIRRILDEPLPQHNAKAIKPTREGPSLAEIEADLVAHRASIGKAAAVEPGA